MTPDDLMKESALILYFTSPECSVCKVLKPKISEMVSKKFPLIRLEFIDVTAHKALAGQFGIFTVPVLLVFFEGKEFFRKVRNISVHELEKTLERPYRLFFE